MLKADPIIAKMKNQKINYDRVLKKLRLYNKLD